MGPEPGGSVIAVRLIMSAGARLLEKIGDGELTATDLLERWQDGSIKLFVTSKLLALRARQPELFARGEYEAISAAGPKADCICGFTRRTGENCAIVLAARFPARLEADPGWSDTRIRFPAYLASRTVRNVLSGGGVSIGRAGGPRPGVRRPAGCRLHYGRISAASRVVAILIETAPRWCDVMQNPLLRLLCSRTGQCKLQLEGCGHAPVPENICHEVFYPAKHFLKAPPGMEPG